MSGVTSATDAINAIQPCTSANCCQQIDALTGRVEALERANRQNAQKIAAASAAILALGGRLVLVEAAAAGAADTLASAAATIARVSAALAALSSAVAPLLAAAPALLAIAAIGAAAILAAIAASQTTGQLQNAIDQANAQIQALFDRVFRAQNTADTAIGNAGRAQSSANAADNRAASAQSSADAASNKADRAQTTADSAAASANRAQTTADSAAASANRAQTTADSAAASANRAQTTADSAAASANRAQTTADSAAASASRAQTTADSGVIAARRAQTTADSAGAAASRAQTTADGANAQSATAIAIARATAARPGIPGPRGAVGAAGAAGAPGIAGPRGAAGAVGAPGIAGPRGAAGAAGAPGIAGPRGATGATGATGAAGIPGISDPTLPVRVAQLESTTAALGEKVRDIPVIRRPGGGEIEIYKPGTGEVVRVPEAEVVDGEFVETDNKLAELDRRLRRTENDNRNNKNDNNRNKQNIVAIINSCCGSSPESEADKKPKKVELEPVVLKKFLRCNPTTGEPEFVTYTTTTVKGTALLEQTKALQLSQIEAQACKECDCVATVPESWRIKPEYQRPQTVLIYREVLADGTLGKDKYPITIPHSTFSNKPNIKPSFSEKLNGNWQGTLLLKDNSAIIVYCRTKAEAQNRINEILTRVNPSKQTGKKPKFTEHPPGTFKEIQLRPYRLDHYPLGATGGGIPAWQLRL